MKIKFLLTTLCFMALMGCQTKNSSTINVADFEKHLVAHDHEQLIDVRSEDE